MTSNAMFPGEHSHSDRPNWRPAETVDEYLFNVSEGLEKHSQERLTKLLGLNRTLAWRAVLMTHIPEGLFERLLKGGVRGTKQLAQVGLTFRRDCGNKPAEIERCPHCGGTVRVRWMVGTKARKIIQQWVDDGLPSTAEIVKTEP